MRQPCNPQMSSSGYQSEQLRARRVTSDPRAWLADIFARIADHPARRITELLPWHWRAVTAAAQAA